MIKANKVIFLVWIAAATLPVASNGATREPVAQQWQHNYEQRVQEPSRLGTPEFGRFGSRDIDRLQASQRERILQGLRSGALTRREASRLMAEQRRIEQEERYYRADGVLTRDERRDLWSDLNAAGRRIYNEAHDAQDRR